MIPTRKKWYYLLSNKLPLIAHFRLNLSKVLFLTLTYFSISNLVLTLCFKPIISDSMFVLLQSHRYNLAISKEEFSLKHSYHCDTIGIFYYNFCFFNNLWCSSVFSFAFRIWTSQAITMAQFSRILAAAVLLMLGKWNTFLYNLTMISEWRWWILSSIINYEIWNIQHYTSVGQRKIWVPDRNRTHDLPNTRRALYRLSYENSWRARQCWS